MVNLTADQIIVDEGETHTHDGFVKLSSERHRIAYVVAEGEVELVAGQFGVDPLGIKREVSPQPWMTAKCETCGGQGFLYMPEDGIACEEPDCIDGKPIHTVEVEHDPSTCLSCKGTDVENYGVGFISYRLVVREVLEVHGPGNGIDGNLAYVNFDPSGATAIVKNGKVERVITLAAKPGDYLAICTVLHD